MLEFYNENTKKAHGDKKEGKVTAGKDESVELNHVAQVTVHRHEDENDKLK